METGSQSPRSDAPVDSAFSGQLREAIQERKGETKATKQRDSNSDSAAEPVKKKDDSPQLPVIVAVIVAAVAIPLPASLGLPSAGVDPGSGAAVSADIAAASVIDAPAPDIIHIDSPTPPAEAASSDPKAELA